MEKIENSVIFFDVDGVLNSWGDRPIRLLNEKNILCLKEIVEQTGARLVCCSTWRKSKPHMARLIKVLSEHGMELSDIAPFTKTGDRPREVLKWLGRQNIKITHFVVLDDDFSEEDYIRWGLGGQVVHTNTYRGGLLDKHIEEAVEILSKEAVYKRRK